MRLNVFAKDMELTDAMEARLNQELDKLGKLEDFVDNAALDVTIRVNKHNHVCEGQIRVNGKDHFAKAVTEDMYQSMTDMVQDLIRQLKKTKSKAEKHSSNKRNDINALNDI